MTKPKLILKQKRKSSCSTHNNGKSLLEWMEQMRKMAEVNAKDVGHLSANTAKSKASVIFHLRKFIASQYHRDDMLLEDVDLSFCTAFVDYMKGIRRGERTLASNTRCTYFKHFTAALNSAVRAGYLYANPVMRMEPSQKPKAIEVVRAYLSQEELHTLFLTPCDSHPQVKLAFLFSCLCGLRWGDIKSLTWGRIVRSGDGYAIELKMGKTQEFLHLPLCRDAVSLLPVPEKGSSSDSELVYHLPTLGCANKALKKWVEEAGVHKKMTFHNARHTFGTLMLTFGADIYTTSKLLGHSDIKVTQIYAKIVDRKKVEAVSLLNGILCNQ